MDTILYIPRKLRKCLRFIKKTEFNAPYVCKVVDCGEAKRFDNIFIIFSDNDSLRQNVCGQSCLIITNFLNATGHLSDLSSAGIEVE